MRKRLLAAGAAALVLAGCGYVGEPLPPLMNIPARVTGLAAVERGARIIVQFSVPPLSTEGVVLKRPPELDLRAGPGPDPFNADTWAAGARKIEPLPVKDNHVLVEIPVNGWAGKEIVLGVRTIGRNGRDAGWSNFVVVAVVPPPARPAALRAESVAQGVHLAWQGGGEQFRVFRKTDQEASYATLGNTEKAEWTDTGTEYGTRYTYLVQGIVKTATGEAESELSEPAPIVPRDLYPPAVPAGLTAVASTATIELAWDRNTEADLAGYRVYRAEGNGALAKVADTGETPSYADRAVEHGKVYRYAVSSVDKAGNESQLSAAVEAMAP